MCNDESRNRLSRVGSACQVARKEIQLLASVCASISIRVDGGGGSGLLAARSGGTTIKPTTNPPKMYFCLRLARLFLISAILCVGKCAVSGATN